jgi:hypothetical protein
MVRMKVGSETMESKNKALVLQGFGAPFNKRDYAAAERFWSPTAFSTALRPSMSSSTGARSCRER